MASRTLVLGNKNYSSWSLRPWLALRQAGLDFEEIVLPLDTPDFRGEVVKHSPTGLVPVLKDGDLTVWDTLAICEYAADLAPDAGLWPEDRSARAIARSVSAEMHSGFKALRAECPMNIRRRSSYTPSDEVSRDVARITDLWTMCRQTYGDGGPFLFGRFTIADAMYAPVATRFRTYGLPESDVARDYIDALLALPAMQEWTRDSHDESWVIARSDL